MDRYAIDERVGCIAVIDTTINSESSCIDCATNIVRLWRGKPETRRRKIRAGICWTVPGRCKREARRLCRKLNKLSEPKE